MRLLVTDATVLTDTIAATGLFIDTRATKYTSTNTNARRTILTYTNVSTNVIFMTKITTLKRAITCLRPYTKT